LTEEQNMTVDYAPKIGDHVRCAKPAGGLKPYTGKVTTVFSGFVRVDFDQPQGPGGLHTFALTAPKNLEFVSPGVVVGAPETMHAINAPAGGGRIYPTGTFSEAPEPLPMTSSVVAPLPPYTPDQAPVVAAVEGQSTAEAVVLEDKKEEPPVEQPTGNTVTASAGLA
jgi:hypothetical protein